MTTKNLLILDELIKSNKISQEAKTVKKINFWHKINYYRTPKNCYEIIKTQNITNTYYSSKQNKSLYRFKRS